NLSDMINQSEAEERWDLAGIGYVLRAWGWLKLTDLHGDIIVTEAFLPNQYKFPFTPQDSVFMEIFRLLNKGIEDLQRTDGNVNAAYIATGDKLFGGNTTRWLKYAYGLKAEAFNQFSNKGALYYPDSVIAYVDKSFASSADDALFVYQNVDAQQGNTMNFWSVERRFLCAGDEYRQTNFVVGLMNGTQYPGAVDPRMTRMLSKDSTGAYHGIDPWVTGGANTFVPAERPWNLWGTQTGTGCPATGTLGKYLFDKSVKFPIMTYFQLQFIKAEAALRKGDQGTARQAYLNGIAAHIDFVNARNAEIGNPNFPQITGVEKTAFLNDPSIAPGTVTLSHIMGQKFIAQWMWAFAETWMDQRRYHYTDMDPVSGTQVFRGFTLPPPDKYDPDNNQKPVQRIRPRYNSDYVWNRDELLKIGGLALDYHTVPMWITQP
ncbi:MAG TPA: SusD/RagB family nutrient-binding outer membrane lipoprotein, partial [Gammaproteobacteria bacterium]